MSLFAGRGVSARQDVQDIAIGMGVRFSISAVHNVLIVIMPENAVVASRTLLRVPER